MMSARVNQKANLLGEAKSVLYEYIEILWQSFKRNYLKLLENICSGFFVFVQVIEDML
jgi:hypothetical protein